MCGIAGIFELWRERAPDAEILNSMGQAIAHRGPDDQGVIVGTHWGLVNRRLAIIGLDSGHQPIANENGTIWITFNGEIYNYRSLRRQLEEKGHAFATETDTEVLVHLYEEYGTQLLSKIEGMFAFAIVDINDHSLFLARDRFGQKPLFYHLTHEGRFVFGSEIPCLLKDPKVSKRVRGQSLFDYLSLGYVPAPYTIFDGIFKLQPSCALQLRFAEDQAIRPWRYWSLPYYPKSRIAFPDAVAETKSLLSAAVNKRLESEVPLGAFLSGGIDSSVVAALMQQHAGRAVQTFTIGFDSPRYDERAYAQCVAEALGTDHHMKVVEARDVDLLRRIMRRSGEPFADSSILPTALLSEFTRGHVTVALSGDAGDELFGGYRRYQAMALYESLSRLPRGFLEAVCGALLTVLPHTREQRTRLALLRRALHALRLPPVPSYASYQEIFSDEAKRMLLKESEQVPYTDYTQEWIARITNGTARDFVEQFMALDAEEYLPGDLLYKVDIASMMASLEVRCPFLDHTLAEFVCSLPRSYKVGPGFSKRLLKTIAADLLPDAILRRPKAGFGVPLSLWLRDELGTMVREMIYWQKEWDPDGFFDSSEVKRIAEEHLDGYQDHSFRIWALLCFRVWHEEIRAAK